MQIAKRIITYSVISLVMSTNSMQVKGNLISNPELLERYRNLDLYKDLLEDEPKTQYKVEVKKKYTIDTSYTVNQVVLNGESKYRPNMHYYNQADEPWGKLPMTTSSTTYAGNACGPTSMAMIVRELTGNTSVNPITIVELAKEKNQFISGTSRHTLPEVIGKYYGLQVNTIRASADVFAREIRNGGLITGVVRDGAYFSGYGHYIVISGINETGQFRVHDSGSRSKSQRWQNPEILLDSIDPSSWRSVY